MSDWFHLHHQCPDEAEDILAELTSNSVRLFPDDKEEDKSSICQLNQALDVLPLPIIIPDQQLSPENVFDSVSQAAADVSTKIPFHLTASSCQQQQSNIKKKKKVVIVEKIPFHMTATSCDQSKTKA